jgi:hypothetical protein
MILTISRLLIEVCSPLCSSSPNLRPSVHLDGGFADHRLVNDSIPAHYARGVRYFPSILMTTVIALVASRSTRGRSLSDDAGPRLSGSFLCIRLPSNAGQLR